MTALLTDLAKAFRMDEAQEVLPMDISLPEIFVLRQLSSREEPAMSELGRKICMDPSSLTRTMDELVEKDFVVRKPDPEDGPVVRAAITAEGKKTITRFEEQRRKKMESIVRQMTSEERRTLLSILRILHARIHGKTG